MDNELYQMMIKNASRHVKGLKPVGFEEEEMNIFRISEVLSICLAKSKEKIVSDIIKCS